MESANDFRILIVGAGICGLAIAQGLTKNGINCVVLERDSKFDFYNRSRDWGVMIHWGKDFLLPLLPADLAASFPEAVLVDPSCKTHEPIPHINCANGETIAQIVMPGMMRASRKKLRHWLASNGAVKIEFSKKLIDIRVVGQTVIAEFDDGTSYKGSLVIGCDGSRSKVRHWLLPANIANVHDTGMTIINHAYKGYSAEQALLLRKPHPIAMLGYLPDLHGQFLLAALDTPDWQDPADWTFQVNHTYWGSPSLEELEEPKTRVKFFKDRCSQMCEPWRTMGLGLSEDTVLPVDRGVQWTPSSWNNHNGMVTLAGDAAHPMLPHRGQGLNNALRDAKYLVDAIKVGIEGQCTLASSITSYEEEMIPRGANDVALSLESAAKTTIALLQESPLVKFNLNSSTA